jgi:hypothetical protein
MPPENKDLTLAEIAEAHRISNDERAARLGLPVPHRPVSIASLPSALRAINDDRERVLRSEAMPRDPLSEMRLVRAQLSEEQENSRLEILKGCSHIRAMAGASSDAGVFATAVHELLMSLGTSNGVSKDETFRRMREAVARLSTLQATPSTADVRYGHRRSREV